MGPQCQQLDAEMGPQESQLVAMGLELFWLSCHMIGRLCITTELCGLSHTYVATRTAL